MAETGLNRGYELFGRRIFLIVAVSTVIIGLFVFACSRQNEAETVQRIKIGVLFPMTGFMADKGEDSVRGVRLAVEEINAAGGITAMEGAVIEPVFADSQGLPDIGMKETERLIKEQAVAAIIGTYQSSVTKKATQVAEQYETPFIVSISIADVITERGFSYTFRIQPKAEFYVREQMRFLSALGELAGHPVRRVALLHENSDFGTASAMAQKKALAAYHLELAAEVTYIADGITDLTREVALVLDAKPDAVLTVTYLRDSILIWRALRELGASTPMLDLAGGTVSPEYVQELGALADGTLTMTEYSKYAAAGDLLNGRFKNRFGMDITGDSAYAYQAVWVLKYALEQAADIDRKKLRSALAASDIKSGPHMILPADRLCFDEQGQNTAARLFISQIQNGELTPVWPPEFAVATVKLKEAPPR